MDALERDGCRRFTDNLGNVRRDDAFRRGAGRVRDDVRHALGRGWVSLAVGRVARVATAAREANLCLDAGDGVDAGGGESRMSGGVLRALGAREKEREGRDAGVRVCCPLVGRPRTRDRERDHGGGLVGVFRRDARAATRLDGDAGDAVTSAKNAVRVIQMLTVLNILHAPHMVIFAICTTVYAIGSGRLLVAVVALYATTSFGINVGSRAGTRDGRRFRCGRKN